MTEKVIDAEFVEDAPKTAPRRRIVAERLEMLAGEAGEVEDLVEGAVDLLGRARELASKGSKLIERAVGAEHRPILPR